MLLADEASLGDSVHTPEECSSHTVGGEGDDEAFSCFGGGVADKGDKKKVLASDGSGSSKAKQDVRGVSGMVLATGGVRRRLDFSKDRISKALSVVRSKKHGMQH